MGNGLSLVHIAARLRQILCSLARPIHKASGRCCQSNVWIGADRDPAQREIPEQLEAFSADIMGSRFGAYPLP